MRLNSRFYKYVLFFLLTIAVVSKPTVAQLTEVKVASGVIVPTPIVLPVGSVTSPEHTFIKVRVDSGINPVFKVYPDGGSSSQSLYWPNEEQRYADIMSGLNFVADVLLSIDAATNVYTLDIFHHNEDGLGGPGLGLLGTDNDGTLDNWILEISHDSTDSHNFHFAVGHAEADAEIPGIEIRPGREGIDPDDAIDFTLDNAGGPLKVILHNTRELSAIAKNVGTGSLWLADHTLTSSTACSDFQVQFYATGSPLLPNDERAIFIEYTPTSTGPVNCNGLTVNGDGDISSNQLRLLGSGHEIEIVLLLDVSYSMNNSIGNGMTRWEGAVEAAGEFLTLLSQLEAGQGKYGVITFPDPDDPNAGNLPSSKSVTSMRTIIGADVAVSRSDLDLLDPNGNTPMGHGIGRAISSSTLGLTPFMSENTENVRVIALLSDGYHNLPRDRAFPAPEDFFTEFQNKNIKVFTVIYGNEGELAFVKDELQAISSASGVPESNPMPLEASDTSDSALRKAFRDFLVNIEGIFLSHEFDPEGKVNAGQEKVHDVIVDAGDSAVSFILNWTTNQTDRLGFELITPDCEIITPQVAASEIDIKYKADTRSKIYTVKGYYLRDPAKHGTWKLRILGNQINSGSESYVWDVMKKSNLFMEPYFDKSSYFTGNTIKIKARLTHRGKAIHGANVQVSLNRPGNSFNNYIANNYVSKSEMANVPASLHLETEIGKKVYVLKEIKKIRFDFAYTYSNIKLYDDGTHGDEAANDGVYTNTYSDTTIPGTYRFFFTASGLSLDGVQFNRQQNVDVYVDTPIIADYVDVVYDYKQYVYQGKPYTRANVTLVARDAFGNAIIKEPYLKPIRFYAKGAELEGKISNNLDGTFSQTVVYPGKTQPQIGFKIGDKILAHRNPANMSGLNYVNEIVEFKAGSAGNTKNQYSDPNAALGKPTLRQEKGFVSLGLRGSLTVCIKNKLLKDGPGDDLFIFEAKEKKYPGIRESYKVEVKSPGGNKFVPLGRLSRRTGSFDLSSIGIKEVEAVRIIDQSGRPITPEGKWITSPGADIDAVGFKYVKKKRKPCLPVQFGIKGGLNFTNLSPSGSRTAVFDWKNKTDFRLGAFVTFNLSKSFAIQPEVYYTKKGVTVDQSATNDSFRIDYLEVPVLFKYKRYITDRILFNFFVGPFAALKLKDNFETGIGLPAIKNHDYGITLGSEISFGNKLLFDVRYTVGIPNIADVPPGSDITVKSKVLSFMIGIEF